MIGAGVIGLGVGRQHARAYAALDRCRVVTVCDRDEARAREVAGEVGAGGIATDYRELLADARIQIVSIASQDDDHFEQTLAALRAGKHVFVEKPLCRSHEDALELKTQWLESGRQLASNLVLRSAPLYGWLREAITSGRLGVVYAFDGDYLYGRIHKITEGWRKDVTDYSVMQGGGIHLVDLMLWLTGQRPESVMAVGTNLATQGTAFRYHDFVAATFQFPSGLVGRVTANFGCVQRHQHVVRVFGTKGTFIYDDAGARLHESRDPECPALTVDHAALPASKGDLIPAFVDAVLAGAAPVMSGQHEFDVVSACLAADRAVAAKQVERVNYV
jgi:predicted dehydrogenase